MWLTQPEKAARLLGNEELRTGGFLPRCLIWDTRAVPTPLPEVETPIPPEVRAAFKDLIHTLLDTYRSASEPKTIPFSPDAARQIREFHNDLVARRRTDLRDVNPFIARWHEQAWRVSLVLHAATWGPEAHLRSIDEETVKAAIKMIKWFGAEQLRLLSVTRDALDMQKLEDLIELVQNYYNGEATLRDLELRNPWKKEEVKRLAAKFKKRVVVEWKRGSERGGRPSEVLKVL